MKARLIYVVDDELNIRELIKSYLIKDGYEVELFSDGESAFHRFSERNADMLIIDIMMQGMDGYSLCREIRKNSNVPIIMVSAKGDEIDRILGLELGSDDYISKPFSPRELVVRVRTIFRRMNDNSGEDAKQSNELKCEDIVLIPDERKVVKGDREIETTTKEYDLLYYLIKNRNRVYTREQLISSIWNYDYIGDTRTIDDLVKRLRKKLGDAGASLTITTVWGYGYKISG